MGILEAPLRFQLIHIKLLDEIISNKLLLQIIK